MKWCFSLLLLLGLFGCSPPAPLPPAWGVRVLPSLDGQWLVRWQGTAPAFIDGVNRGRSGELRVEAKGTHRVELGSESLILKPRMNAVCSTRRFAVLGDGRAALDGVGPSAYWAGILGEALALKPDAVLHTGDFVKNGDAAVEWRNYLRSLPSWPPIIGVRGNHDRGEIFDRMKIAYGDIYALELGPLLLVGLDSEVPVDRFEQMIRELDVILSRNTQRWTAVMLHRPVWSQGNHGSDERGVNHLLVPVLDRHSVDLVLSGHDHNYERFCPTLGLGENRRCDPTHGVTYLITGGAATFTNHWPGVSRKVDAETARIDGRSSQVFSGSKHFMELEVSPARLKVIVHRTRTGNLRPAGIIDRFELNREAVGCPP